MMEETNTLYYEMAVLDTGLTVHITEKEEPMGSLFVVATVTTDEYFKNDEYRQYDNLEVVDAGPAGRGDAYEIIVKAEGDDDDEYYW